jgi:hypothetical protein
MRSDTFVAAAAFVVITAGALAAQTEPTLSPLEVAVACAQPPTLAGAPDGALRIIGSQDSVRRSLLGSRDLLVLNGGTQAGVQLGQQFFVRRAIRFGAASTGSGHGAKTLGWIRIVAVNDSTAIATVDHICGGIVTDDYLEPFVAPVLPANADRDDSTGEPDFTALGRIIIGNEDRAATGPGDFVLIDRGTEQGVMPGARFAVYRDIGAAGMPLASIGEGIVISTRETVALTRITRTRDAVFSGDYVAMRK